MASIDTERALDALRFIAAHPSCPEPWRIARSALELADAPDRKTITLPFSPEDVMNAAPSHEGGAFKESLVPVDGYADAFYDLASLLKIGAQDKAPREVWYEIMFPRIAKAIIALEESSWKPMDSAPKAGLIDIWTDRRHIDCYYDRICDEWRCITAGHLIRLKDAKYWMHRPSPAEVPAKRSDD